MTILFVILIFVISIILHITYKNRNSYLSQTKEEKLKQVYRERIKELEKERKKGSIEAAELQQFYKEELKKFL